MPLTAALVAACALAATAAQADDKDPPVAQTLAPTDFAGTLVILHGTVDAGDQRTTYWFEIGPTIAYGSTTQPVSLNKKDPVPVLSVISGLNKTGTYHARLVARNEDGLSLGADVTFTGLGRLPAADPAAAPAGTDPSDDATAGATAPDDDEDAAPAALPPAAPPALGQSIAVAPQTGNVLVKVPGAKRAVALTELASIPVGSLVDARKGSVDLSTALPGGDTQQGRFHGGLFEVRQPAGARGMTELILRGPMPACAAGGGAARAAGASGKRPPRRALWGRDDHGRFRTRGSNSVATVRGTVWYVEDRCDGTLTRVSKGRVSVRDLHRDRTVTVRAGKSYLARRAR